MPHVITSTIDSTTSINYTVLSFKKQRFSTQLIKFNRRPSLNLFDVSRKSVVLSAPLWQEIITYRTIKSAIPLHVASARVDCSYHSSDIGKRKSFFNITPNKYTLENHKLPEQQKNRE